MSGKLEEAVTRVRVSLHLRINSKLFKSSKLPSGIWFLLSLHGVIMTVGSPHLTIWALAGRGASPPISPFYDDPLFSLQLPSSAFVGKLFSGTVFFPHGFSCLQSSISVFRPLQYAGSCARPWSTMYLQSTVWSRMLSLCFSQCIRRESGQHLMVL